MRYALLYSNAHGRQHLNILLTSRAQTAIVGADVGCIMGAGEGGSERVIGARVGADVGWTMGTGDAIGS